MMISAAEMKKLRNSNPRKRRKYVTKKQKVLRAIKLFCKKKRLRKRMMLH